MNFYKINSYIEDLYKERETITRKEFINNTKLKDFIPVIDDDSARFLRVIIKILKPKRILEIGTSIGYSTTVMAQMVKEYGGKIVTVEYDEKAAKAAKENFIKAGIDENVELKFGDALEILPSLNEKFDLVFQDVDKKLYPLLLNDCVRLLKKGGILIADDTLFPVIDLDKKWENQIKPIDEFNKLVSSKEELESTLLPIGDGIMVAVKN
ncbi:O-methyltransferase [Clostridium felsineum]|uniref:tRNA 5-hydroxyuridine methyltransferase n=1 Tax=Clostridium felsineum TaxID=36839 RepID=A0A1S8LFZ4_9CLOT|nr:O-methyltransferase [Clostridium felsineum]MCR3760823.1 O-methyltransferase [Clostridium felsineum]URZ08327.1 tRNA 5-hydroxyuridine methyltransferase [Clostridium felsineum]URZ13358.1 tRNA 5-hydroxyuridine methyltransferase [Clostridium felsineum]